MRARSGCVRGFAARQGAGLPASRGRAARVAAARTGASLRLRTKPAASIRRRAGAVRQTPSSSSRLLVSCAATGNNGGDSWKEKYDKAVNQDLPKFWKDFRKQAGLRAEVVLDDVQRSFGKLNRKFKLTNKADRIRDEVRSRASEVDNKFGVTTKLTNAVEDLRRNYPELKRKFQTFSETTTGKVVLYGAFIYLIFSGIYLKILYAFFLISLFSPLFLPYLQQLLQNQQEKAARAQAQAQGGPTNLNDFFQQFARGGAGSAANPNVQQQQQWGRQQQKQPGQSQDEVIIDAEFESIDDDESK